MPFPGYPLATNKSNTTVMPNDHAPHHNALAVAVNDLQAQVDAPIVTADIANGAVTAAKVAADVATQAELDALARGLVGTATAVNLNQTGINATVDVTGVAAAFTAVAGRKYVVRFTVGSFYFQTVNGQGAFYATDELNNTLGLSTVYQTPVNTLIRASASCESDPFTISAGAHTAKLKAAPVSGTDMTIDNVFGRARISVYDVGPV